VAWVVVKGRALGNHRKLQMSKKRKGVLHKGSLSFLAAESLAPVALPPPSCHRNFIIVLMGTCIINSCSIAIAKGFTWPSAGPTKLWKSDTELIQTFWFPFPALASSQPGRECALSSPQPAGCNLSFPCCLKTVSPGTSNIIAGVWIFLNFLTCVSVIQNR